MYGLDDEGRMDDRIVNAGYLLGHYDGLVQERSELNRLWQSVSEYISHTQHVFSGIGANSKRGIYDSTASQALEKFIAIMDGLLTPRQSLWHRLYITDAHVNQMSEVQEYLNAVCDALFQARYRSESGFVDSLYQSYKSLGLFGTQILYTSMGNKSAPIVYKSMPLENTYIDTGYDGRPQRVFCSFTLKPWQAAQKWGIKKLPDHLRSAYEASSQDDCKFLMCILPRNDCSHFKYVCYYVDIMSGQIIANSGYYDFPFHISRFYVSSDRYGYSPAINALADIKMLNSLSGSILRSAQKMVDPPLAVPDDGIISVPNLNPGAVNIGGLDTNGKMVIQPITTGMQPALGLELVKQKRMAINDAFWVSLFSIFQGGQQARTATEVVERINEKVHIISPVLARQETELFGHMIKREIDLLDRQGLLPERPSIMQYMDIDVEYSSPLARLRGQEELKRVFDVLKVCKEMSQMLPGNLSVIDPSKVVEKIAHIYGRDMFLDDYDKVAHTEQKT